MTIFQIAATLGIIGSLLWTIGDLLIVGFVPQKEKYKDYLDHWGDEKYIYYLGASEKRLRFGALIANFAIPFYIFASYTVYLVCNKSTMGILLALLTAIGYMYAPVAHCSFYYTATIYNYGYEMFKREKNTEPIEEITKGYQKMQILSWGISVFISFCTWIFLALWILLGKTILPPWFAIFTPTSIALLLFILSKWIPGKLKYYINCAALNIAMLLFYLPLLLYISL